MSKLKDYYNKLTEGLALEELWGQFRSDAQSSYRLYSDGVRTSEIEGLPGWKRSIKLTWAIFLSMIMFLSPARRVFLVLTLILALSNRTAPIGVIGLFILFALELADRVTMKRDLEIARDIQKWLVPESPPQVEGLDIAFATRAANTVGGDYFDALVQDPEAEGLPRRLLFVVADVAGKSVPAALLMATIQSSFRALVSSESNLETLVNGLNKYTCTRSAGGRRFTTAFLAEYLPEQRLFRYINAGHNYPFLRRKSGELETLKAGGIPLGIVEDTSYSVGETLLEVGESVFMYTDGLVEAINAEDEEFGEDRLIQLLSSLWHHESQHLVSETFQAIDTFTGLTRQYDDMTCLVLKLTPVPPEPPQDVSGQV